MINISELIKQRYPHFNLTDDEISILEQHITTCYFKRNDLFLKEGTPCEKIGVIFKGTAYSYKMDDNGEEVIKHFFYPNNQDILFNYESYLQNESSNLNIKFQEESFVGFFDIQEIINLYTEYPRFLHLEMLLVKQQFQYALQRSKTLQLGTAEEKIKLLQKHKPKAFELFPYSHIASYLGIHRNTFRRVFSKQQ
ncbi:Crp/Fnr family transcriptional regulator [Cellulophaga baltica]|uniref:Crp/Fnr family transcriptional regulator n=1 Tax=Cellulophaga TaxID=104264 RepID=UPI001C075E98|nr:MULTISPECIES: Crp/Fnr family transcriptional regulator [Cellulophaga]MBU2996437.1 Crp/Fnr family transcriptional regulator [Cellulophaga baltica]MDO6767832.1 Crp/Fnr family transcriptional regulator [Cellulophaga sp. 1_MG-2023]